MARQAGPARLSVRRPLVLTVELEHERATGRWIADVVDIPGVMVYGRTQVDAFRQAQALAFEVLADRLKHGEHPLTGHRAQPRPFGGIRFAPARQTAMAR